MLVKAEFQASPVSRKPGCRSHLQLRGSAGGAWIILAVFCWWSQHYAAHWHRTLPLGDRPGTRHHDLLTFLPFVPALSRSALWHLHSYRNASTLVHVSCPPPTTHVRRRYPHRSTLSHFRHCRSPATMPASRSPLTLTLAVWLQADMSLCIQIALRTACSRVVKAELTSDRMLESAISIVFLLGTSAPEP